VGKARLGLFFDFDGTLSPLDVLRDEAGIPLETKSMLLDLAREFTLAIVSSKDCHFLLSKAPYVRNYACLNGLEVVTEDYICVNRCVYNEETYRRLMEIVDLLNKIPGVFIERKLTMTGRLTGISIDWREVGVKPPQVDEIVKEANARGLKVVSFGNYPFIDIYVCNANKADGVKVLKSLLNLDRIVYVGDGENDIPAFNVADVSVLVRHQYNKNLSVKVDYEVSFNELPKWLMKYVKHASLD